MSPTDFQKLQAEWDARLAADGFRDIEYRDPGKAHNLKGYSAHTLRTGHSDAKTAYWQRAERWLHLMREERKYRNRLYKPITLWSAWVYGKPRICELVEKWGLSKMTLYRRVHAIEERMNSVLDRLDQAPDDRPDLTEAEVMFHLTVHERGLEVGYGASRTPRRGGVYDQ